jgi:hypothetical protein
VYHTLADSGLDTPAAESQQILQTTHDKRVGLAADIEGVEKYR